MTRSDAPGGAGMDAREAATEIERLRAEVAPVRCPCCDGYRDRGDDLAALRTRVAELEAVLAELARLKIHKDAFGKTDEYLRRQPAAWERVRAAVNASATPTPDPRDARIAEVEQAAIQWRLRMAELETEAQESDARIAVLEAELTLVEETATALGLKSMAASARRALEGRRLPDPRDARIAVLEAALRPFAEAARRNLIDGRMHPARRHHYSKMSGAFPLKVAATRRAGSGPAAPQPRARARRRGRAAGR